MQGYYNGIEMVLGYDEFYDHSDSIGIVESDVEPFGFLSTRSFTSTLTKSETGLLPRFVLEVSLGDTKKVYERTAYTLFTLLGDFGGFNGAIIIFPAYLMSQFSSNKYSQAVYKGVHIRKTKKKQSVNQTTLRNQLASGAPLDTRLIHETIKGQVHPKPKFSVWSSLRIMNVCKRDR